MPSISLVEEKPRKLQKRKKLRRLRLVVQEKMYKKKVHERIIVGAVIGLSITLLLAAAAYHFTQTKEEGMFKDFVNSYRRHYNQIRCSDTDANINTRISSHGILHQDFALQHLEMALRRNESNLNSIAIVGPVGVGKSTWSSALKDNFPQENVHSYAWNTFVMDDEVEKFRVVRRFVDNFSDCGCNLLIIDNLRPCDVDVVPIVNKFITDSIGDSKKRVVVIYIFNVAVSYELQLLPNTQTVKFKEFGIEELKDCIRLEALGANLTLTLEAFDEIVDTIDVRRSGCKNVRAKVLAYGELRS